MGDFDARIGIPSPCLTVSISDSDSAVTPRQETESQSETGNGDIHDRALSPFFIFFQCRNSKPFKECRKIRWPVNARQRNQGSVYPQPAYAEEKSSIHPSVLRFSRICFTILFYYILFYSVILYSSMGGSLWNVSVCFLSVCVGCLEDCCR